MSELKELQGILSNNEFLNNSNNLSQVIQRIFAALEGFGMSLQGIAQELKNINLQVLSNLEQISSSNSVTVKRFGTSYNKCLILMLVLDSTDKVNFP